MSGGRSVYAAYAVLGRQHAREPVAPGARKVLGWPERCKLAHTLNPVGIQLQKAEIGLELLGQLGVFLTWGRAAVDRGPRQSR